MVRGPGAPQFDRKASRAFDTFLRNIRRRLFEMRVAQGAETGPVELTSEETKLFRETYLGSLAISEELRRLLVDRRTSMGRLFERWLPQAVAELIDQDELLRDRVAAVYEHVELFRGSTAVAELDVVVLFNSGDLVELEAKAHYSTANRKEIEARIKALRDYCGAYSKYVLVFPLTQQDVRDLAMCDSDTLNTFHQLGMTDADRWGRFLGAVQPERDQEVVGIDRIGDFLRKVGGASGLVDG